MGLFKALSDGFTGGGAPTYDSSGAVGRKESELGVNSSGQHQTETWSDYTTRQNEYNRAEEEKKNNGSW